MKGSKSIETIRLENMLSYGPNTKPFPLEPLNVLIGPNASGKSNLIEALSLLAAAPWDLQTPIGGGGGVNAWLWKGAVPAPTTTIEATVRFPRVNTNGTTLIKYSLSFTETFGRFVIVDEAIEDKGSVTTHNTPPYLYYRYRFQGSGPVIDTVTPSHGNYQRQLRWDDVKPDQSILSQRRDRYTYPELTFLGELFGLISIYRGWTFGPYAPPRLAQRTDLPQQFLLPDASNLGVLLSNLLNEPKVKPQIIDRMKDFYPSFQDINTRLSFGTVQTFFHEHGLQDSIPATRISDGSLRYLCLLAILCHPVPPPIVCIEEPEVGMHPDVIPEIATLLTEASSRCQIFVTTHSDVLVDALTDIPESIIVCEKEDGSTQLRRLDAGELKPWLGKFRLGELWTQGRFGGNRW